MSEDERQQQDAAAAADAAAEAAAAAGDEGEPPRDGKRRAKKVLSEKKLQRMKEAHERRGIVYVSRIPPHMKPQKLRHLLSQYGEIGRVYCTPEDRAARSNRKKKGGNTGAPARPSTEPQHRPPAPSPAASASVRTGASPGAPLPRCRRDPRASGRPSALLNLAAGQAAAAAATPARPGLTAPPCPLPPQPPRRQELHRGLGGV
jgi:hypothetical protein